MTTPIKEVRYRSIIPDEPLHPIIDVEIIGYANVPCILDSGANRSLFPKDIGLFLNVDYNRHPDSFCECAHGKKIHVWEAQAKVKIFGEVFTLPIFCSDLQEQTALLGRTGFFDRYLITFDEDESKVFFQKKLNT